MKCCFLCSKELAEEEVVECQECHQAWFCSQECLVELHQPPKCFPLKVEKNESVGRYLVAARDLAPGEIGPVHHQKVIFTLDGATKLKEYSDSYFSAITHCLKMTKMSHLNFSILAIFGITLKM